jgi:chromate reductase, NAD(P)H dehydrogenase (quinone)
MRIEHQAELARIEEMRRYAEGRRRFEPTGPRILPAAVTKVLLVSGSLRAKSVNSAVLRTAAAVARDGIRTSLYGGMGTLPHFNPDEDPEGGPVRTAVADLRQRLSDADAVLFCTPEYAGSLPGSFKNLLDWTVAGGETYGMAVAWINASSRLGPDAGSGAHDALRTVLGYTGADIADAACRRIRVPRTAVGADGLITDAAIRDGVATTLGTLADYAAPTNVRGSMSGDVPDVRGIGRAHHGH